jgi:hypothetical protein
VFAAQHFHDKTIKPAVAVDVREVNSHGSIAHVSPGHAVHRPELAAPIVEPDPIRSLEIVANIDVRRSVPVDVAHLNVETKIRLRFRRPPVLIAK